MRQERELEIESRLTKLETTLNEVATNHLPHLSEDIKKLERTIGKINVKLGYWSGGIVVAVWLLERFIK